MDLLRKKSGATNLIKLYIALNWGENGFCHPKSKLCRYSK